MSWKSITSQIADGAESALQGLRATADAVIQQNVRAQMGLARETAAASNRGAANSPSWRDAGLRGPVGPEPKGRTPSPGRNYVDSREEFLRQNSPPGGWATLQWPLPDRYGLNARNTATGQGDGRFGNNRTNPDGSPRAHKGIDVTAPEGTQIYAAGDGKVLSVGPGKGYGMFVEIDHGDGISTRYAHIGEADVRPGDKVRRGQSIATTGRSGNVPDAAQAHLHFEVRKDGRARDPYGRLGPSAYRATPNADQLLRAWRD